MPITRMPWAGQAGRGAQGPYQWLRRWAGVISHAKIPGPESREEPRPGESGALGVRLVERLIAPGVILVPPVASGIVARVSVQLYPDVLPVKAQAMKDTRQALALMDAVLDADAHQGDDLQVLRLVLQVML